jgi:hypothetical protein
VKTIKGKKLKKAVHKKNLKFMMFECAEEKNIVKNTIIEKM